MTARSDGNRDSSGEDPSQAGARERAPDAARIFSVGELSREIKGVLERLGRVSVEGEISRITRAASGHVYFDLKDFESKLACTIWRSQLATAARFELEEGMQVVVHGRLDVYAPRGTYSLNVQRLEQRGLGTLLEKLEALKLELRARGWFDRRRPLPQLPRVIGVVTSRDGAAFQDFLRTRTLRWPLYPVRLAHTPVQGAGAAREIAAAIARLDQSGVDVIVVCRGGGSLEDLWAFNELAVAEAIWNASVPVVSGVGHETDATLCDFVADHRAHTPTDAAQCVLPDRAALVAALERAANHLAQAIDGALDEREQRLERSGCSRVLRDASFLFEQRGEALTRNARALELALANVCATRTARLEHLALRLKGETPGLRLERAQHRLSALEPRLLQAIERPLAAAERRLERAGSVLEATSPFRVLARGYSITRRVGASAPLSSIAGLAPGDRVETLVSDGRIESSVERTRDGVA